MNLAPIAIFTFNRPKHTKETIAALAKNELAKESPLFIFIDGPKIQSDVDAQTEIKYFIQLYEKSFKSVEVSISDKNKGLANSITKGVDYILTKFEKIIVLEDDLVTSPLFLKYMNKALDLYQNSENIFSINGHMFPVDFGSNETFLSPLATSSWGWATWRKRWEVFSMETPFKSVIQNNEFIKNRFNIGDLRYDLYLNNNNSWAIRWYYHVFSRNGLGLFPTVSLVQNIGFDGSGTHCESRSYTELNFAKELPNLVLINSINLEYEAKLRSFFKAKKSKNVFKKVLSKIKIIIKKIK